MMCVNERQGGWREEERNRTKAKAETPVVLFKNERYIGVEEIIGIEILLISILHSPSLSLYYC